MPADVSTAVRLEPVSLRISRRGPGIVAAVTSLLLAVLGTISWIDEDSSRMPRTILGIACWGGAIYATRIAVRDLWGTLTVDADGIRLLPHVCGFRLSWSLISMWCLEGDTETSRAALFRFWRSGYDTPSSLPAKWFSRNDRVQLIQALRDFAGEKARRF